MKLDKKERKKSLEELYEKRHRHELINWKGEM